MVTSSLARAALSAAIVGVLLVVLRRVSPRAGGLTAAVPFSSLPALFWLSVEHGGGYASSAALGALWCTGLTALLGLTFARLAQRCHTALAAMLAFLTIGAAAALIWSKPDALTLVTAFSLGAILIGRRVQRRPSIGPRKQAGRFTDLASMGMAGAMSLAVSELSAHCGPQFCGLIAAIPVIGMTAVCASGRRGGVAVMFGVLDGYLIGQLAKAAFLGALCLAWGAGAGPWAWALAVVGAGCALLAQRGLQSLRTSLIRHHRVPG